jgi:hypothetical protein
MNIDTLLSYHKEEASEELAYLTIIYSAVFGILGYLGSARKIYPQVRIVICVMFSIFLFTFISAFLDSLEIHDALHVEIRNYFALHPSDFIGQEQSRLYKCLMEKMVPHDHDHIILMSFGLGTILNLGLLTIGEGRVFSMTNYFRKKNK